MKIKKLVSIILVLLIVMSMAGCSAKIDNPPKVEPDILKIRNICQLATLECYYHNVAKSVVQPEGIVRFVQSDNEFWIEYDGIVKLGIDMSMVRMSLDGNNITITIPPAKILDVSVNPNSYNASSYYKNDGLFKAKITAEDAVKAVEQSKNEMEKTAKANTNLLSSAQDRAKELIENYIGQIGEVTNTDYNISWEYLDNTTAPVTEPAVEALP